MQNVLGYWYSVPRDPEETALALARVRDHYAPMAGNSLTLHAVIGPKTGLAAMVGDERRTAWPPWQSEGRFVCGTVHVPLGWRGLVGQLPIGSGPLSVMDALLRDRAKLVDVAPPFGLMRLDRDSGQLDVVNDGLGYVRLYVFETSEELVISSRLGAIPIFRAAAPTRSLAGWQTSGAAGWFMGDRTPIDGIRHLGPGSHVHAQPGARPLTKTFDAVRVWTTPRGRPEPAGIRAAADQMARFATDVGEVWSGPPTIHLSGGRDSRAAAAGYVARNIPATFRTVATLEGELAIAEKLLARIGRTSDHVVVRERDNSASGEIRERAAALHRAFDGVYGPGGLKQPLMRSFGASPGPVVTGAAGEIARGNFYKGEILETIRKRGEMGPFLRLDRLYAVYGCTNPEARESVAEGIRQALQNGRDDGLDGPALLDYFYFVERLRRWANPSARIGTLTPLASPAYVRAAFDQSPEDKLAERFHLDVIGELVPEWRDIGFYKASPDDTRRMTRPRLWATGDRLGTIEILEDPSLWDDVFDAKALRELWTDVEADNGRTRHETVLHRVIWRATYDRHLTVLASAGRAEPVAGWDAGRRWRAGWLEIGIIREQAPADYGS